MKKSYFSLPVQILSWSFFYTFIYLFSIIFASQVIYFSHLQDLQMLNLNIFRNFKRLPLKSTKRKPEQSLLGTTFGSLISVKPAAREYVEIANLEKVVFFIYFLKILQFPQEKNVLCYFLTRHFYRISLFHFWRDFFF